MTHTVMVRGTRLEVIGGRVVAGSRGCDSVELDLDRSWSGLEVTLVLGSGDSAVAVEWSGEPVTVPSELTLVPGAVAVSVVGRSADGSVRVTEEAPGAIAVVPGGMVDAREGE